MAAYEVLLLNTSIPQIQAAQTGDTYVVPRDIAFSAALTLSAGTANGVPYLNASNVLTTGSALWFDGTNFGVGTAGNSLNHQSVLYKGGANSVYFQVGNGATGLAATQGLRLGVTTAGAGELYSVTSMASYIDNTEQMRLTSTGLGIGTSSPAYKLDVSGQARALEGGTGSGDGGLIGATSAHNGNAGVLFQTNSASRWNLTTSGTNGASLRFYNYALASTVATFDSSGNLGLGVTPGTAFDIGGRGNSTNIQTRILTTNAAGSSTRFQTTVNADTGFVTFASDPGGNGSGRGFAFNVQATQAMTLDASGNLGVGTTSPFADTNYRSIDLRGTTGGEVVLGSTSVREATITADGTNGMILNTVTANPLRFYTQGSERARITSGGYFKASNDGTYFDATGAHHELRQSASVDTVFITNANASPTNMSVITSRYTGASPNNTTTYFLYCSDGGSTARANIRTNGGLANYQSNNVDLSDIRTKTDISPLASYWNKIAALEIVTYKYKDQTHDDLNIGVIAQQVEQVAPEFVDADGFGETPEDGVPLKTIYNKDLTFAAIKALQEAMARIEQLEAKVAAMGA